MSVRKFAYVTGAVWVSILSHPAQAVDCSPLLEKSSAEYRACEVKNNDERLGKYFCYITHTVGIERPLKPDGTVNKNADSFSGNLKPKNEKFLMDISRNSWPGCDLGAMCADLTAPFKFSKNSDDEPKQGFGQSTYTFRYFGDIFKLSDDLTFTSFTSSWSAYVSQGHCEKIN